MIPVEQRFLVKVQKTESCWLWTGAKTEKYGTFWYEKRNVPAHRMAYSLWKGQIPEGLVIDHLCKVHICVNPEHLEAVTLRENIRRGDNFIAKNMAKTHCPKGHEYIEENTYLKPRAKYPNQINRVCKRCRNDRQMLRVKLNIERNKL